MKFNVMISLGVALTLSGCNSGTPSQPKSGATQEAGTAVPSKLWVTSERLARYTCPSEYCGVVGKLHFREAAEVLEESNGWVRITKVYNAACENGESAYVDEGNSKCEAGNGIVDGKFAEWVKRANLSETRPDDPAETASADESLVAQSDDFGRYRQSFAKIAARLIEEGRCTPDDFKEMGGFMKSVSQHKNEPVYFTYCGGMTSANKVYVNAQTGETVS